MQIKLSHRTKRQGAVLLGALIGIGLVLGGCAIKAIVSKAHKIEQKRRQQASNDVVEAGEGFKASVSEHWKMIDEDTAVLVPATNGVSQ